MYGYFTKCTCVSYQAGFPVQSFELLETQTLYFAQKEILKIKMTIKSGAVGSYNLKRFNSSTSHKDRY